MVSRSEKKKNIVHSKTKKGTKPNKNKENIVHLKTARKRTGASPLALACYFCCYGIPRRYLKDCRVASLLAMTNLIGFLRKTDDFCRRSSESGFEQIGKSPRCVIARRAASPTRQSLSRQHGIPERFPEHPSDRGNSAPAPRKTARVPPCVIARRAQPDVAIFK